MSATDCGLTVADRILHEYHRRLSHAQHVVPLNAQVQGELIGLRGALGIALGGDVKGGDADRLAHARYAEWGASEEAASASCACRMCLGDE
ncbi:hypothetical protein ACFRCX_30345 [Streptomyces sp. NPDC056652]|uniref:hypothetical protein n=1 Tax=Streptomyces sp. NPDC056652 TaxID=3345893 RepID=UPI003679C119